MKKVHYSPEGKGRWRKLDVTNINDFNSIAGPDNHAVINRHARNQNFGKFSCKRRTID